MSLRKSLEVSRRNLTTNEEALRAKQEAKIFELGVPLCPEQYIYNNKPLYKIWKFYIARMFEERILSFADGDAVLALSKAKLNGDRELQQKVFDKTWKGRPRFPKPVESGANLNNFLDRVAAERLTFKERLVPGATLCVDSAGPYEWPDGDAATVARRYALDVIEGAIVAGELLRRAAQRFITDLESAHERGLFFDPLAARHIVHFAEMFCGLKLMAWEVFFFANIYGWKRPSGVRRFTEALCSVAKKNGKTAIGAVAGLWGLVCDQEKYADVFCSATKKEQSRLVWRDAKRMVGANEELRNHVTRWSGSLNVTETDSSMTALSSDVKSMDGTRGSTFICDELHMWGDREQFDKLVKGGVSRTQPLCIAITTAGESKFSFCWKKFDLGEKILRGIYLADETFILIYQLDPTDDFRDPSVWCKANPSLGITLKVEHLKQTLAEVEQDPSGQNAFLRYHMNQWIDGTLNRAGSIPTKKWDACSGLELIGEQDLMKATVKFLQLNADTPCYIGVDVGLTSDLTAVAMFFPKARFAEGADLIDKKVVVVQCFAPEIGLLEKERAWGVPLSIWSRAGWLQLLPGDLTDPREIRKYIVDLHSRFRVMDVRFDPWQFSVAGAELNEAGIAAVGVPQTAKELTAPCRELLTAVNSKELVHFANPILAWMAGNIILVENEKHSGVKPEKLSPNEKIDGLAAVINAWHGFLTNPPFTSVYASRGIVFLDQPVSNT